MTIDLILILPEFRKVIKSGNTIENREPFFLWISSMLDLVKINFGTVFANFQILYAGSEL